jgi:hypothetical protein
LSVEWTVVGHLSTPGCCGAVGTSLAFLAAVPVALALVVQLVRMRMEN